jgi:hypothetical protein
MLASFEGCRTKGAVFGTRRQAAVPKQQARFGWHLTAQNGQRKTPSRGYMHLTCFYPSGIRERFRLGGPPGILKLRINLRPRQFLCLAQSSTVWPPARNRLFLRTSRNILGLASVCVLGLLLGCNSYNPYLGASPTVSSSITSITPNGANAPASQDLALTVIGSGFAPGSSVTWNSSNSPSTNLASNVVSSTEVHASIPASFLKSPGTFFVGVAAPAPSSGNNAGNNISNFVPFRVCPVSGCTSVMPSASPRVLAHPSASVSIQIARYQAVVADSPDGSVDTGTASARIFLRDSCLGAATACAPQIIPISVGWNGADPNGPSSSPSVTSDGRLVVFASEANNLVKGDSNGWSDIFLRDTCIAAASACVPATIRVSIGPDGAETNGPSYAPAISPDGRFVIFNSSATNLVRPDFLNSFPPTSTPPSFLRDTCFGAASGCVPTTSRVIPASALPR